MCNYGRKYASCHKSQTQILSRNQSTNVNTDLLGDDTVTPPVTSLDISSGLSEEQAEMQSMALNFAMKEMFPKMSEWDQNHVFPVDVLR